MKITLDLDDLVATGKLTAAEAERLKGLASHDAGSLAVNVMLAFGVVAIVSAISLLFPNPLTVLVLGLILFGGGMSILFTGSEAWTLLARMCITIGGLMVCGGLTPYVGTSPLTLSLMSIALGAVAVLARSGLLASVSVLGLGGAITSGYGEAGSTWDLFSPRPTLGIATFAVLALALLFVSMRLRPVYERLAIIAARTAVLVVNLGFLFASIFGDSRLGIPGQTFAIVWAVLLVGAAVWGARVERRWVVNAAATFGAIHFIVQWFVYLGANPLSVLGGGVLFIAFGMGLFALNRRWRPRVQATA